MADVKANAGKRQRVDEGSLVTLDGSRSRADQGETLTFAWTQTVGPPVSLTGADTVNPTFTAPQVDQSTQLRFQLTVTQSGGNSDSANVRIDVRNTGITVGNEPPLASAGGDRTVTPGSFVLLDPSGSSDPEGQPLTYAWTQVSGPPVDIQPVDVSRGQYGFTAPTQAAEPVVVRLTVTDSQGASDSDDAAITVAAPANNPPTANAGPDQQAVSGAVVTLNGSGSSDPDGDTLSFAWSQVSGPPVTIQNPAQANASFSAPAGPATIVLRLTVDDGRGGTASDDIAITVAAAANSAPTASAGADRTVAPGSPVLLDPAGSSDPEGQPLSYAWTQVSGPTVSISPVNGQGQATFTAPPAGSAPVVVRLSVRDPQGLEGTDEVSINVPPAENRPPTAVAGGDQQVGTGATVVLNAGGSSDPDGDPLAYQWTQVGGPPIALSNPNQQVSSFVAPNTSAPLDLIFQVTVTDGRGGSASDEILIQVQGKVVGGPVANAGPDMNVTSGPVTLNGSASSDPAGLPLTFQWVELAGPAVPIRNAGSAVASFTAPSVEVPTLLTFQLTVTSAGGSSVDLVTFTIVPAGTPPPPPQEPQQPILSASVDAFSVYPNPFDPAAGPVHLAYTLGVESDVTVTIYDLFGRLVREFKPTGARGLNLAEWDGRNGEGRPVGNGGYVVQIRAVDGAGHSARAKERLAVVR